MTNRYKASCAGCGQTVVPHGGTLKKVGRRWEVRHLSCEDGSGVDVIETSGGTFTRNKNGLCEDAPCCGCCTI
jgi:hypothetical protein